MFKKSIKILTIISTLIFSINAFAWEENKHYTTFSSPPENTKNTVIEWFWIGCPHCKSMEPVFDKWKNETKPENIEFIQIPAGFNRTWQQNAMFVYSLMAINKFENQKELIYDIMIDPNHPFRTTKDEDYYKSLGYTRNEVLKAMQKPEFIEIIKRNEFLSHKYRSVIDGVPFVVVNGKYLIKSENVEQEEFPELINYLLTLPVNDYMPIDIEKEIEKMLK